MAKKILKNYDLEYYDEYDECANEIVDAVFEMIIEGRQKEDIKYEVGGDIV